MQLKLKYFNNIKVHNAEEKNQELLDQTRNVTEAEKVLREGLEAAETKLLVQEETIIKLELTGINNKA